MEADGLQTRKSRLELNARPTYFPGGRMTVRCESNQFQLYKKFSVMELTDDSPRLAQMISPTTVLSAGKRSRDHFQITLTYRVSEIYFTPK